MEGDGKEVWKSGSEYEGQFHQGMKHGQGALIHKGKVHTGAWEKNAKHGIGYEAQIAAGTRRKGEWKKNKLFRWLSGTETASGSIKTNKEVDMDIEELKKMPEEEQIQEEGEGSDQDAEGQEQ